MVAKKQLRIVLLSAFSPAIEIANRLVAKGIGTSLILPCQSISTVRYFEQRLTPIFYGTRPGKSCVMNPLTLLKQLILFRPDVIHMWCAGGKFALAVMPIVLLYSKIIRRCAVALVSTIWEPRPRLGVRFTILGWFELKLETKIASRIVTDALLSRDEIMSVHKVPFDKVDVIPDFEWDAAAYTRWKVADLAEEQWILFFGEVLEHKGLSYLIEAEPRITREFPSVKIVVAGSVQEKFYRHLRNKGNFVVLNRYITYEEASMLFQKCCIVVLPYVDATVSGIVPVAYSFKKPVVATNVGAFPEIIDDGRTGILVPPKNSTALADAIRFLLRDKARREEMGENGYTKLRTELSWDVTIDQLVSVYRQVSTTKVRRGNGNGLTQS